MNGITNAQQGSGGGGSAASYKAIKSMISYDDWEEVTGATPFFVGDDAMQWPVDAEIDAPIKSQGTNLGLVAGNSYIMTIVADNVTYKTTATAFSGGGNAVMAGFDFSTPQLDLYVYVYDKWDAATMSPAAQGSTCAIDAEADSLVITNFEGKGFDKSIQATISDSAIKVNSAVTMYTNTSEKIAVGEKTDGSVTLVAEVAPELSILYSLEIIGTDTEGLFELINGYVPVAGITDYDKLQNVPIVNDVLNASDFTPVVGTYYRHTGETNTDYTKGAIYKCIPASRPNKPPVLSPVLSAYEISEGVENMLMEFAADNLPFEKTISNTDTDVSTKVSIEGTASPYIFSITDDNVYASDFVRLYPTDEATEDWLNEHTLSSIITEELHKFTFKVDTPTLPATYSFTYIVECR